MPARGRIWTGSVGPLSEVGSARNISMRHRQGPCHSGPRDTSFQACVSLGGARPRCGERGGWCDEEQATRHAAEPNPSPRLEPLGGEGNAVDFSLLKPNHAFTTDRAPVRLSREVIELELGQEEAQDFRTATVDDSQGWGKDTKGGIPWRTSQGGAPPDPDSLTGSA